MINLNLDNIPLNRNTYSKEKSILKVNESKNIQDQDDMSNSHKNNKKFMDENNKKSIKKRNGERIDVKR